jgi:2-C-methyl-D-erythritol 4-phosphate cytidylyltransferase
LKKFAVIVAGGSGTRMKTTIPKQFLLLSGTPLLQHCLTAFHKADPEIELFVVLPVALFQDWEKLQALQSLSIKHSIVPGGETRFHSVKNALQHISEDGFVAVHDGVRPLITAEFINFCFDSAVRKGSVVPVIPVSDSIRLIDGVESRPGNRNCFRSVQTPQVFESKKIKMAYNQPYCEAFTDDATVMESIGEKIMLINGLQKNIKITTPGDLLIAEALFSSND